MEETLDQISAILPSDFFHVESDLHYVLKKEEKKPLRKRYQLPDFGELVFENSFAGVFAGWNEEGLIFDFVIRKAYDEGDSVEIFVDTRDLKTAGFPTRFCHHFAICPKPIDGVSAMEVTTFRTEDRHDHCLPEKLFVAAEFSAKKYNMKIILPSDCLHGYDPSSFEKLGFAYRISRKNREPQHFALSSRYVHLEKQPSLWSTMVMRKK